MRVTKDVMLCLSVTLEYVWFEGAAITLLTEVIVLLLCYAIGFRISVP